MPLIDNEGIPRFTNLVAERSSLQEARDDAMSRYMRLVGGDYTPLNNLLRMSDSPRPVQAPRNTPVSVRDAITVIPGRGVWDESGALVGCDCGYCEEIRDRYAASQMQPANPPTVAPESFQRAERGLTLETVPDDLVPVHELSGARGGCGAGAGCFCESCCNVRARWLADTFLVEEEAPTTVPTPPAPRTRLKVEVVHGDSLQISYNEIVLAAIGVRGFSWDAKDCVKTFLREQTIPSDSSKEADKIRQRIANEAIQKVRARYL